MSNKEELKKPSFLLSFIIIAFMFVVIIAQLVVGADPEIHLTLVFSITFAVALLMAQGTKWKFIEEGILHGCTIATVPMLILMFIGMLIPTLISCGTIPSLIYFGLKMINPTVFLLTACLICSVSSVCTGSSYTTAGTFGVAFMGISVGLGIPPALTAGAVISGAVLGDKMSPLSDSTNLAAGVCETGLFQHIKAMMFTTLPAYVICLVLYGILGMKYTADSINLESVEEIFTAIEGNFSLSTGSIILGLLPLVLIVAMAIKQVNALATMVAASVFAMLISLFAQDYSILELMGFMNYGFSIDAGSDMVNALLNRGGIQSMMWTVSLGYIGMSFGGILEKTGVLDALLEKLGAVIKTARALVITHILSAFLVNLVSASQYVAIIISGRMFLPAYKKLKLEGFLASRTCEDSGTVTSPLVPWGLCGVFFTGTLGVSTWDYAPYAFLCYITPLVAIVLSLFGLFLWKKKDEDIEDENLLNEEA